MKESEVFGEIEIPVLQPPIEKFVNFREFMKTLEDDGINIAKVIPPKEWQAHSKLVDPDYILKTVVNQVGEDLSGGAFSVSTDSTQMTYSEFEEWAMFAEANLSGLTIEEIEDQHWANMHLERKYAINNEISLFGDVQVWNLDELTKNESNLHFAQPHHNYENVMSGVQSSNFYAAGPLTSFAWHLEDGYLNSINYLHRGAPKFWYHVPPQYNGKLEKLATSLSKKMNCDYYIGHKTTMIPPTVLKKRKIPFGRLIQNPGEFVVSMTKAYHSGFNCGLNHAEAVNFGSEKWLEVFHESKTCHCKMQHAIFLPKYCCPTCDSAFNSKYGLLNHLKNKHKVNDLKIEDMEKFNKKVKNTKRVQQVKEKKKANKIIRKTVTCIHCGKSYKGAFNFNRHLPQCRTTESVMQATAVAETQVITGEPSQSPAPVVERSNDDQMMEVDHQIETDMFDLPAENAESAVPITTVAENPIIAEESLQSPAPVVERSISFVSEEKVSETTPKMTNYRIPKLARKLLQPQPLAKRP
ncbi:lysine-specific demethylase 4D-like [Sitodiplosis mosellana]|uniref:lysine-specific demethylase 4D-like n=1 Tax=Sitodiplosis mosellana TaxID=263140 RepID=UPI0024450516|nr:lysine-specific demethylase 4D-like [Sitodiplosis mosellana]